MQRSAARVLKTLLPILVFLLCLGVSVGYYAAYGQHNLDSDISSEFVLAQLLNEEGRVFLTDSWYYSTELRIVSPVPVYQLMLRLFSDWHVARTVSIAVLLCGVALSLVYLARGLGVSLTASLLCAGALVLPITPYNSFTLVYGGFYTVCVMLTFVQIGLVLRMDRKRLREPLLLILLGVYGGLNGVRMPMICVAPLLAACLILLFLDMRRCESLSGILALPSLRLAAGGVLLTLATLIGYAVNTNVLAYAYDFELFGETALCPLSVETFTDQIICLMSFFGYRNDVLLLSLEGVVSVLSVLLPVAGAAAMILLLRMPLNARERLAALFMPIALALGMLINVLTLLDDHTAPLPYSVSYYMPAALLLVFALFWVLDRFACRLRVLRVVPMLALVGVFLAGNAAYRDKEMHTYNTELENIAQYLLEEDCVQGYATFWNANVLTEITDGEIDVYSVENWSTGDFNAWLQRKDHRDWAPVGSIFAIFTTQDLENGVPGCDEEHLFYSSDDLCVVIYDSNEEFLAARGHAS